MRLPLFALVLYLFLGGCGAAGEQTTRTMPTSSHEIILQTYAGSDLDLRDGRFVGTHPETDRLNGLVERDDVSVRPIENPVAAIGDYRLFRLTTAADPRILVRDLLELRGLVDGAYEKPTTEDAADPGHR